MSYLWESWAASKDTLLFMLDDRRATLFGLSDGHLFSFRLHRLTKDGCNSLH